MLRGELLLHVHVRLVGATTTACATSVAGPAAALLREAGAARDIATRRLRADYAQLAGHTRSGGAA